VGAGAAANAMAHRAINSRFFSFNHFKSIDVPFAPTAISKWRTGPGSAYFDFKAAKF
jgi:hypothetical protein